MTIHRPLDNSSEQTGRPAPRREELRQFTRRDLNSVVQRKRRLPHWELSSSTYFVTFRAVEAVGQVFLPSIEMALASSSRNPEPIRSSSRSSQTVCLARSEQHSDVLRVRQGKEAVPRLADIVERAIRFFSGNRYALDAHVTMPNHVHLLIQPLSNWTLGRILQGLKGFTAREINRALGRVGRFWQNESFDHLIRNEEDWLDKRDYIHNNPVKAGLVENPGEYPFSTLAIEIDSR